MEELLAQLDQDEARDWEATWLALVVDSRIERLKGWFQMKIMV